MERTSSSSYRNHKYSGAKKNLKRVRSQLRVHHGPGVTHADVFRKKAEPRAERKTKKSKSKNNIRTYVPKHRRAKDNNELNIMNKPFTSDKESINITDPSLGTSELVIEQCSPVTELYNPAFCGVKREEANLEENVGSVETDIEMNNDDPLKADDTVKKMGIDNKHFQSSQSTSLDNIIDENDALQEAYYCNECANFICGFRYICVQCTDFDLCNMCEAKGLHDLHYMLRVPKQKPNEEITKVLEKLREELFFKDDVIVGSIKDEIKVESDPLEATEKTIFNTENQLMYAESMISSCATEVESCTDLNTSLGRSDVTMGVLPRLVAESALDTTIPEIETEVHKQTMYRIFVQQDVGPLSSELMSKTSNFKAPVVTNTLTRTDQIMTTDPIVRNIMGGPQNSNNTTPAPIHENLTSESHMSNLKTTSGLNSMIISNPRSMMCPMLGPITFANATPTVGDVQLNNLIVVPANILNTNQINERGKR